MKGGKRIKGLSNEEILIAQIANPYSSCLKDERIENIPSNFVIHNEISLLLNGKGIEISTVKKEKEKIGCIMEELCKLKKVFDKNGIKYVLIKLPKLPKPLSDIDILIIKGIEGVNFALKQIGYVLEDDTEPHRRTYIGEVNKERIAVDLHSELSWRRVVYLDKEEIWKNSVNREINEINIPAPSPDYELLIYAAHTLFKNNKISLFDVLYVNYIIKENFVNMNLIRSIAKRNGWHKQISFFFELVSTIYEELYAASKNFQENKIESLPLIFPLHIFISIRVAKIFSDLRYSGAKIALTDLCAYSLDVMQFISEQKLGIHLLPFFNPISSLKRGLRK